MLVSLGGSLVHWASFLFLMLLCVSSREDSVRVLEATESQSRMDAYPLPSLPSDRENRMSKEGFPWSPEGLSLPWGLPSLSGEPCYTGGDPTS